MQRPAAPGPIAAPVTLATDTGPGGPATVAPAAEGPPTLSAEPGENAPHETGRSPGAPAAVRRRPWPVRAATAAAIVLAATAVLRSSSRRTRRA